MADRRTWGTAPGEARARLQSLEWDNVRNRRDRLSGARPFPVELPLKPPTGPQMEADIEGFIAYVNGWKRDPCAHLVEWAEIKLRRMGVQAVPRRLVLPDMRTLATFLGQQARHWLDAVEARVAQVQALVPAGDRTIARRADELAAMSTAEFEGLLTAVDQLKRGMGGGQYLRALTIPGVHTKLLEDNAALIAAVIDARTGGDVTRAGGLLPWLEALARPTPELLVRVLCPKARRRLNGLELFWANAETLARFTPPASTILVVENNDCALALPLLDDTLCVSRGGRNLAYLTGEWLGQRRLIYWGDLDAAGFSILADCRRRAPGTRSMLMDRRAVQAHLHLAQEDTTASPAPALDMLTMEEREAWRMLSEDRGARLRIEQEHITAAHVLSELLAVPLSLCSGESSPPLDFEAEPPP